MRVKFAITAMLLLALGALGAASTAVGALPDGRAYELVSPPLKGSQDVENGTVFSPERGIAGVAGAGYAFVTMNGLPGSESGALFQANHSFRTSTGWTTLPVSPADTNQLTALVGKPILWSRGLDTTLVGSTRKLTPDAPPNSYNLFIRTSSPTTYTLVTPLPNNQLEFQANPLGASADFGRVYFQAALPLSADAPPPAGGYPEQLFEWTAAGGLKDVTILPGQTTPSGAATALPSQFDVNHVSEDGASVIFEAVSAGNFQVFRRAAGATVEVSAPAAGVVDPNGPQSANFAGASPDGSVVYFTSKGKLTADAQTGTNDTSANLYRYEVATGALTDLTVLGETLPGVNQVLVSRNGKSVYFTATGALVGGATAGKQNLYRWSEANGLSFIATLAANDQMATGIEGPGAAAAEDGTAFAFTSEAGLAGHLAAAGIPEIYRYAQGEPLACVSCAATPGTGARILAPTTRGGAEGNPISSNGSQVFFTTADALVAEDTNGVNDAYEWEHGAARLISVGTSEAESTFLDADPSGTDAFFLTRDRLVGADIDENTDVYDARVGGGFPEPPPAAPPCEAEACRAAPEAAPSTPATISSTFQGPHDQKPVHKKPKKTKQKAKRHKQAKKKQQSNKSRSAGKRG
jgi:hypothetical protein